MPSLIVETSGVRRGGAITSRVLIGRLPTNGIVLADSSVSRLHAWIDCDLDGLYYVADTGSLTGTWVNGKAVERRAELHEGDTIRVGKATLTYHEANELPDDAKPLNLAGHPPMDNVEQAGVLFECVCGAPAWFKATAIGHPHKCRQCGNTVIIPDVPGARAHLVGEPVTAEASESAGGAPESFGGHTSPASPNPYAEHGLTESFATQTAVAEAESPEFHAEPAQPESALPATEELHEAPVFDEAPAHNGEHLDLAHEPTAYEPTADELTAEPQTDHTSEPLDVHAIHDDALHEGPATEEAEAGEYASGEYAHEAPASEAPEYTEHAEHAPDTAAEEEPSSEMIADIQAELESRPAADPEPAMESEPAERPSLFASRRRPLAEPHPLPSDAAPPLHNVPSIPVETASSNTIAVPSPLDAFDAYTGEDSTAVEEISTSADDVHTPGTHAHTGVEESFPSHAEDDPHTAVQTCSVCHTAIQHAEATTTCPSCGLTFHAECWQENQGCSAYGCPQVGALAPKEQPQPAEGAALFEGTDEAEASESFPWEYIFLVASVVGTLLGLLVFGVPSAIAALGSLIYKLRFHPKSRPQGVVLLSIVVAVVGIGVGVVASYYWWFGGFGTGGKAHAR